MTRQRFYITPEGYERLRIQLDELQTIKRPAALRDLQAVSGGADWRESAGQMQLQDQLGLLDAEIHRLEVLLTDSEVIEPDGDDTIIDIGETVVLQTNGDMNTYAIVGPTEANPDEGRISYQSPIGSALLKRQVGDEFDVTIPAGNIHCRIVAVR